MNTGACGSALPLHNRGPPVLHAVLPRLISLPSTKVHVWTSPTCGRTAYRGALGELSRLRPDVNVDDQPGHLTVPSFALRTQEVRKPQHQRGIALTYENAAHVLSRLGFTSAAFAVSVRHTHASADFAVSGLSVNLLKLPSGGRIEEVLY
jgi:hypothetical protein